MPPRETITESAIPRILETLGSPWAPQVELELAAWDAPRGQLRPDYHVRLRWHGEEYEFVAESKSRSTPKTVDQAIWQAGRYAAATGLLPMIIVPFLSDPRLDRLAKEDVSGLDLSGNGIVIVPGRLLLRRSGQPNRYPESQPTRYAYRGATSLVPRVFLCRHEYATVSEIKDEVVARGGSIALSTVSKALARMEEDVLIERTDSRIALLQPDALLGKLTDGFRPPARRQTVRVKAGIPIGRLFQRANDKRARPRLVLSGASSADRYAAGLRSDELIAYCEDLTDVRRRIGEGWQETERFADLCVVETNARTPFFDTRRDNAGVAFGSPVQAYLELAAGDKRDREVAAEIRESILRNVA